MGAETIIVARTDGEAANLLGESHATTASSSHTLRVSLLIDVIKEPSTRTDCVFHMLVRSWVMQTATSTPVTTPSSSAPPPQAPGTTHSSSHLLSFGPNYSPDVWVCCACVLSSRPLNEVMAEAREQGASGSEIERITDQWMAKACLRRCVCIWSSAEHLEWSRLMMVVLPPVIKMQS